MQRWYWCGHSRSVVHVDDNETDLPDYGDRAAFFERTVSGRKVGIKIRNLTKVHSKSLYMVSVAKNFTSRRNFGLLIINRINQMY